MKKYLKNLSLISSVILRKLRLRQKKWFSYEKTCASRNWAFLSGFQYGFKSSRSTEDLLTVLSHRIARTFNSSRATRAELYVKLLRRFRMMVSYIGLRPMGFQVGYLALFRNRRLRVVLVGNIFKDI